MSILAMPIDEPTKTQLEEGDEPHLGQVERDRPRRRGSEDCPVATLPVAVSGARAPASDTYLRYRPRQISPAYNRGAMFALPLAPPCP